MDTSQKTLRHLAVRKISTSNKSLRLSDNSPFPLVKFALVTFSPAQNVTFRITYRCVFS